MSKPYRYVSSSSNHKSQETSPRRNNTKKLLYEDDIDDDIKRKHEKKTHAKDEEDSSNSGNERKEDSFFELIINLIKRATSLRGSMSKIFNETLSSKSNSQGSSNFGDIGSMIFSLLNSSEKGTENKDPFASFSMLTSLFKNSPIASNLFTEFTKNMANSADSNSTTNERGGSEKLQDALMGFKNILNSLNKN